MKKIIRICALLSTLLLFTGCGRLPGFGKPVWETPPPATTEPEASATIPSETAPTAASTAATAATEPVESAPASTVPTATEPEIPAVAAGFGDVYTDICRLLDTGDRGLSYAYANVGVMEVVGSFETAEERYQSITYALEDIDRNGSREMILVDAADNSRILAIFMLQDGAPVMTHEGWYRSRLYRLSNGSIYHEGSGGAAYSIFEAHGQCWFTYPKDENQTEIGFYHAVDGTYDPATAREITAEEYRTKQEELTGQITVFSVYPFR